jgi:S1-C subfamily serine protease
LLDGVEFAIASNTFTTEFRNWVGQPSPPPQATYLIIELAITNRSTRPLESTFQPVFRLVDETGTLFAPSGQHTIAINMNTSGGGIMESLNPDVSVRKKVVFDVPVRKYDLQVIVPSEASAGLIDLLGSGQMRVRGNHFFFDLPLTAILRPGRIGIQVDPAQHAILTILDGSPASKAGLAVGDVLLEADGASLAGLPYTDLMSRLHGAAGSHLKLKIRRGEEIKLVDVVRE